MKATTFPSISSVSIAPRFPASYQRNAQRIALPYLNRTIFICVDDILCLQGEGNYTFLYTRDQKRYLVSKTLKEFEKTLDASIFPRIHKSYIINLAYVRHTVLGKEHLVQMIDGRTVGVSRRRVKAITQQLNQYSQWLYN